MDEGHRSAILASPRGRSGVLPSLACIGGAGHRPNATSIGGADPPVRGPRPRRPAVLAKSLIIRAKSGTRASRADQGVRPTDSAEFPLLGLIRVALGHWPSHVSLFESQRDRLSHLGLTKQPLGARRSS